MVQILKSVVDFLTRIWYAVVKLTWNVILKVVVFVARECISLVTAIDAEQTREASVRRVLLVG